MSVAAFLDQLRAMDIQVWVDGGQLRCNAPSGGLPAEIRDHLRQRKDEILAFLHTANSLACQQRAIVPLQPYGDRDPVFAVAGHNGDVFCYRALVQHLGNDQPFFGLQPPGLDGHGEPFATVEGLAAYFASQIHVFRPGGPCIVAGYCAGGTIAFELACQLVQQGFVVRHLVLFGCPDPAWYRFFPQLRNDLSDQMDRAVKHFRAMASRSPSEGLQYLRQKWQQRRAQRDAEAAAERNPDPALALRARVEKLTLAAVRDYTPQHFDGHINALLPSRSWACSREGALRWRSALADSTDEYCGADGCNGDNILREPHVSETAALFRQCRDKSEIKPATRRVIPSGQPPSMFEQALGQTVQMD